MPIKQFLTNKDVKITKKEVLHRGFCNIERYHLQHQQFDGTWSEIYTREFMHKPRVAAALPYDPDNDNVVLIEQFRIGAFGIAKTPWLIEIVAGIMDHAQDQSLEDLMHREMREETNLTINKLIPICEYLVTPGCSTEMVKLFCATVDSLKAPKYCGVITEQEDIRIHVVKSSEAFAAVRSGQINNAAAIIALQWLELNLSALTPSLSHHKQRDGRGGIC